jgi:hypothetical protein
MEFNYTLSLPSEGSSYASQLKQYCLSNKYRYPIIQVNKFTNSINVSIRIIELKTRKYPNGEIMKYSDGNTKKEKVQIYQNVKVYPRNMNMNQAYEAISFDTLQSIFSPILHHEALHKTESTVDNEILTVKIENCPLEDQYDSVDGDENILSFN